jgi:hypothetical protein
MEASLLQALLRLTGERAVLNEFVEVSTFPCGSTMIRGMRAKRNISKGTIVIRVPNDVFCSAENILSLFAPQLREDVLHREQAIRNLFRLSSTFRISSSESQSSTERDAIVHLLAAWESWYKSLITFVPKYYFGQGGDSTCGPSTLKQFSPSGDLWHALQRLSATNNTTEQSHIESGFAAVEESLQSVFGNVSLLASAEVVLTFFLLLAKYAPDCLSSCANTGLASDPHREHRDMMILYVAQLPDLESMSTPEIFFLREYEGCPEAYLSPPASVAIAASSTASSSSLPAKYNKQQTIALIGSAVRFQKLTRRMEKQFQKYQLLLQNYLRPPAGTTAAACTAATSTNPKSTLEAIGAIVSFERWLWAHHMINSRSFMYTKPKDSDYPRRYSFAGTEADNDGSEEEEEEDEEQDDDDDEDDEDAMLRAVTLAKEEAVRRNKEKRNDSDRQRDGGAANVSLQLGAKLSELNAEVERQQRMGGAPSATDVDSGADDSDVTTSDDDDDDDEGAQEVPEPDLYALVPFADYLNHNPQEGLGNFYVVTRRTQRTTEDGDDGKQSRLIGDLVVIADRHVLEGEEVCIRYNAMDHWRFAKYYGFVPDPSPHARGSASRFSKHDDQLRDRVCPTDCFPIFVPGPSQSSPLMLSTTAAKQRVEDDKRRIDPSHSFANQIVSQVFDSAEFRKHCFVTSLGPNAQLRSVCRLRFLSGAEVGEYYRAYETEFLSVQNEWQAYQFLVEELTLRLREVKRNMLPPQTMQRAADASDDDARSTTVKSESPVGLSHRALTIVSVRDRDYAVLSLALSKCKAILCDLSGLLYCGTSTTNILRRNVIHEQFRKLQQLGHMPVTEDEQRQLNLTCVPLPLPVSHPYYRSVLAKKPLTTTTSTTSSSSPQKSIGPQKYVDPRQTAEAQSVFESMALRLATRSDQYSVGDSVDELFQRIHKIYE